MKKLVLALSACMFAILISCGAAEKESEPKAHNHATTVASTDTIKVGNVEKTEAEWREILTEDQYYVLREDGTEPAFSSDLLDIKAEGVYHCAACGLPLFSSETKFESGTGWPSFWKPIEPQVVDEVDDRSMGMLRIEIECAQCGSHIGHVFNDGPEPTGLRYCMNGAALKFKAS